MFLFSDKSSEVLLFPLTSVQLKRPATAHSHLILSPLHRSDPPCLSAQGELWEIFYKECVFTVLSTLAAWHLQEPLLTKSF